MSSDVTLLPATEQAALIRSRQLSAHELLDATFARLDAVNPAINAVIVTQREVAIERAAQADADAANGTFWGPLHGLPVTVKEVIDWVGVPSTWGVPELANYMPTKNAAVVDRLLGAGAILYGKTNVPIMLGEWQSHNAIYGTTNNPWDLTKTPGGSSGGSAAAIATGLASLEVGSDIGGSIRLPASHCGVFGHQSTFGSVAVAGHEFPGQAGVVDINVLGPLTRTAGDLDLAWQVLADHPELHPPAKTKLSDFRAAVMLTSEIGEQDDEVTNAIQGAVDALVDAGLTADSSARPAIDQMEQHDNYRLLVRAANGGVEPADALAQAAIDALRYDEGDRHYRVLEAKGATMSHRDWILANNRREEFRRAWTEFFGEFDVLLCPIAATVAPPHDQDIPFGDRELTVNGKQVSLMDQWFWSGWSCGVYLPSTMAPVGVSRSGLPVGMQIIAPFQQDRTAIAFAAEVERVLGPAPLPPLPTP